MIPTLEPVTKAAQEPLDPLRFAVQVWFGLCSTLEWLFGAVTLIASLAVLAAIPVVQFLSLGYLLEAGGRIARTGRFREGFIGVRTAARIGGLFLGVWLMVLPLRYVSSLWLSSELIEPGGTTARVWRLILLVLTIVMVLHIAVAVAVGGKLRHFLVPFLNPIWLALRIWRGQYYSAARDAVWDFVLSLRLPYYFWLGLRGFVGGFLWFFIPITLLALSRKVPPLFFLGAPLLMIVLLYVPFLQIHFAARNSFWALFDVVGVRSHYRRAPWAFAFAFFSTLLLAVPLYLLKIEIVPREAAWLPSLFFIVFIFPARLLAGWAYGRAERRITPRHWFFRWTGRLAMLGIVWMYVLIVYFSQYAAWEGVWSLYEQHAFLLPVPFLAL